MKSLSELGAVLLFYKQNIHMLHWKTRGPNFMNDHTLMQTIYQDIELDIDIIGEMTMQYGLIPLSMSTVLSSLESDSILHVEIDGTDDYDHDTTVNNATTALQIITNTLISARMFDKLSSGHQSDLDAMISKYQKYLMLLTFSK